MTYKIAPTVGESRHILKRAKGLRILMVHWDGGGNGPPQRALARELKRRGHQVHVLTHDSLAGR